DLAIGAGIAVGLTCDAADRVVSVADQPSGTASARRVKPPLGESAGRRLVVEGDAANVTARDYRRPAEAVEAHGVRGAVGERDAAQATGGIVVEPGGVAGFVGDTQEVATIGHGRDRRTAIAGDPRGGDEAVG